MTGLSASLMASMTARADAAIDHALLHGSAWMHKPPSTEVGLVAAVTLDGVKRIASAWTPLFAGTGYSLTMQGVFCHAAPVVEFTGSSGLKTGCELADLLIVTDLDDGSGQMYRRASLVQAKMANCATQVKLTGPSSQKQLYLLQSWPSFEFRDPEYGTDSYSLLSVGSGDAGSFGVIDRHLRKHRGLPPIWTQHASNPTPYKVTTEPSLGAFIVGMIGGTVARFGRVATPGGADDWSKVVDLLLSVTYRKTFKHTPTLGSYSPSRGVTSTAFLMATSGNNATQKRKTASQWRPPLDGFEVIEDENPNGISILRIEIVREG